jgi:hypothetical protein
MHAAQLGSEHHHHAQQQGRMNIEASVLAQLGLIDVATLPVCGADTARKALDPSLPANALIRRAALM